MSALSSFAKWAGVDDDWQRPRPTNWRPDVVLVLVLAVIDALEVVIVTSVYDFDSPLWAVLPTTLAGIIPLAVRRRWPLWVTAYGGVYLFVSAMLVPEMPIFVTVQFACFFALYSGVAWARDRRLLLIIAGGVLLFMFAWIAWHFSVGAGFQRMGEITSQAPSDGILPSYAAVVLQSLLMNTAYFLGALSIGQSAWRQARARALIAQQGAQLEAQSVELRDQAVVNERLRIARELHDVVAHHVSVMGIQAAAARRVLDSNPNAAEQALRSVEESARSAVTEMRGLLGTLRSSDGDRAPQPSLADLPAAIERIGGDSLQVSHQLTSDVPGLAERVPAPVALTIHRTVTEALTNTVRHSTARRATVAIRLQGTSEPKFAEVEITDDGTPRGGTSGSGLGQEGMRERVGALGGTIELGPRAVGGYRVRARIPLRIEEAS